MGKFRIRLKLQGLEVEVDGDREDIPAITTAVSNQISGLVLPAENFADGRKQLSDGSSNNGAGSDEEKKRRARRTPRASGDGIGAQPIEFRHDAAKYGNPLQTWGVAEKCIWLLYIVKGVTGTNEVSGPQLAATFNQYFKPAGKIHPPHVTRDLAKVKVQNPAPIGEDKGNFYLTDAGDRQAEQLIQSVLAAK